MLNREAKRRRKANPNIQVVGPTENVRIRFKEVLAIMGRPYKVRTISLSMITVLTFKDAGHGAYRRFSVPAKRLQRRFDLQLP